MGKTCLAAGVPVTFLAIERIKTSNFLLKSENNIERINISKYKNLENCVLFNIQISDDMLFMNMGCFHSL